MVFKKSFGSGTRTHDLCVQAQVITDRYIIRPQALHVDGKWESEIQFCKQNQSMILMSDQKMEGTIRKAQNLSYIILEAQCKQNYNDGATARERLECIIQF